MDTLTIVREIIDLAAERDSLHAERDSLIAAYGKLQERSATQAGFIDAQRIRIEQLHADLCSSAAHNLTLSDLSESQTEVIARLNAELDALRSAAPASPPTASMTREQILSVAREALATGRQVYATMNDGKTYTVAIKEIDDSRLPIRFDHGTCELAWEYLACESDPECDSGIPKLSLLELL